MRRENLVRVFHKLTYGYRGADLVNGWLFPSDPSVRPI